jgi:CubicO group peptidase (beta-lactamase class C family)
MNLKPFIEGIEKQKLNVEGIIVFQRGRELARHRWAPEQPKNIFSVSKSFASVAVGMAIDEGKLRLSDRVTEVFPRKKPDARWDALTLEHLLTMNMGHGEFTRPASVEEALSCELVRDPGTWFLYDNTCTFLASAMLTRATGLKTRDYLLDRLFRPLGISDPEWGESEDGYTLGATGLVLSTTDLSLFGRFLLQRGNWEGKQLVSVSWLDAATRTQVATRPSQDKPDYDLGYGYQFWICRHGAFRCDGKDGQFVVVIPSIDAVITISSDEENMKQILWTVWDHILPGIKV